MFKFFKKKKDTEVDKTESFEIELTATILAYEIARSDGSISETELDLLLNEVKKIATKVNKSENEILKIIETYSQNSVSFYEFIEEINNSYSKKEKLSLLKYLWDVAYADNIYSIFVLECLSNNMKILIDSKYFKNIFFEKKSFINVNYSKIPKFLK